MDISDSQYNEAFVISDIHGCYDEFEDMLQYWDKERQLLILNGDFIDRGPKSLEVIKKVNELRTNYPHQVFTNWGNHEEMFIMVLNKPGLFDSVMNVGMLETFESLLPGRDREQIMNEPYETLVSILDENDDELSDFIEGLSEYIIFGDVLVVHAGVNPGVDWEETSSHDETLWYRGFHYQKNKTGKVIVVGHTPTNNINSDKSYNVIINRDGNIVSIDGGVCFGGQLNGIVIERSGKVLSAYASKIKEGVG